MTNKNDHNKTIGGKAYNLKVLKKNGLVVPKYFVISIKFYESFLKHNNLDKKIEKILENYDSKETKKLETISKKIADLFLKNNIPKEDRDKIINQFEKIKKQTKSKYFAVRSSGVSEDNKKQSFAGQFDSFLFISRKKDLINYIKRCWASTYSKRALIYRKTNDMTLSNFSMAVIVQEMIDGEKSGVIFTANPQNNNDDEIIINATYGIGEGIVSGELKTDVFVFNKNDKSIKSDIAKKEKKIVFNKKTNFGTIKKEIKKELRTNPTLSKKEIKELAHLAEKIEKIYNFPQDIEWTIKDKQIYILQTRPITTIARKGKNKIIWDNSNITESFPGITKPLTFSFAKMAWGHVYRETSKAMGISKKKIKENDELFNNMLGLIHGRVYYNLNNWYKMLLFYPFSKKNKQYYEEMIGLKETVEYNKKNSSGLKKIFHLSRVVLGILKNYLTLDKEIKLFQKNFNKNYKKIDDKDFEKLNSKELLEIFNYQKINLMKNWKIEGINDFYAMIFYGLLQNLSDRYDLFTKDSVFNDLFCGEEDMDSTKPTRFLFSIAKYIKSDKKLLDLFQKNNEKDLLKELNKPEFKGLNKKLSEYLDKFGYRFMNELKLEEKTLRDDPSFLIRILKNYLDIKDLNIEHIHENELKKRKTAERIVNEKLRFNLFKKILFNWVLSNARKNVKYRENLRLYRTKIFGVTRNLFRNIGRDFKENKIIDDFNDIFYLKIGEISDFINGSIKENSLKELIKKRKKEYNKFENEELPERIFTYGKDKERIVKDYKNSESNQKKDVLKGIIASPGVVTNKVKIILTKKDDIKLNGEIIVAEKTDPGWVLLYPSASGLLIERGSVLSHSAIVARELGLPTIVGIKDLTKKIKEGQIVKMDANKGIVYLKNKKKEK